MSVTAVLKIKDQNGNWVEVPELHSETAYEAAVREGYTGTESEFYHQISEFTQDCEDAQAAAQSANSAKDQILGMHATASGLPAGSSPTVNYDDGVMAFGIPKGDKGTTPQFTVGTVTDLPHGDDPAVQIDNTDPDHPVIDFQIPHGASGNESIDDTAGLGDDDLVWSADKLTKDFMKVDGQKANSENLYLYKEASGDVVTVDDAVAEIVKQMRIEIAPVQDLHGYENPWPAGGGKNLLEITAETQTAHGVTFTINKDSAGNVISVTANGTASADIYFKLITYFNLSSGEYICNGCPTGGGNNTFFLSVYANNGNWKGADKGTGLTFTVPSDYTPNEYDRVEIIISSGVTVSNVVFKPMIRLSSVSDDTFAPYENICPITGRTGCNVTRTGKNLIPNNYSSRTINGVTFSVNNDGSISVSGTPTGNATFAMTFDVNAELGVVVLNGIDYATNIRWDTVTLLTANKKTIVTFGQTDDKERIIDLSQYPTVARMSVVFKRKVNDEEVSGTVYPMLRKQSESADWEPYQGTTYPITFPGTVYGGDLTIHADGTGELVVDRGMWTIDGTESNWEYTTASSGRRFRINVSNIPGMAGSGDADTVKSDKFIWANSSNATWGHVRLMSQYLNFTDNNSVFDGLASFKAWLSNNNTQVFAPLAEPVSYELTAPQVRTLLGLNHIWADAGSILSFLYATDNNAKKDGTHEDLTAGNALYLLSDRGDTDVAPYVFRKTGGAKNGYGREFLRKIVGGTVVWNQLAPAFSSENRWTSQNGNIEFGTNSATFTSTEKSIAQAIKLNDLAGGLPLIKGHKYYISFYALLSQSSQIWVQSMDAQWAVSAVEVSASTKTNITNIFESTRETGGSAYFGIYLGYGSDGLDIGETATISNLIVIDLTQMFGSTIADAIYAMEQATAGSGAAWFRSLFPNSYYAYDAGSLQSVMAKEKVTRGFNCWDGEITHGYYWGYDSNNNMIKVPHGQRACSTNLIDVIPNEMYYLKNSNPDTMINFVDSDGKYISHTVWLPAINTIITVPDNACKMCFTLDENSYTDKQVLINISKPTGTPKNGDYVPYASHTYPLDSSLTLRGIPKWDSTNGLYYDGDEYTPDGSVKRRFGIVDLGTLEYTYNSSSQTFVSTGLNSLAKFTGNAGIAGNLFCKNYLTYSLASLNNDAFNGVAIGGSSGLSIKDLAYDDATTFKTAVSGVYLVYELATPTTEQADPYRELQISANGGTEEFIDAGVTASTPTRDVSVPVGTETFYPIDVVAYIEELTNPDHDMVADAQIPSGKYFMVGNSLYKSTSQIQAGATIIPGSNCTAKTLAEALNELNA